MMRNGNKIMMPPISFGINSRVNLASACSIKTEPGGLVIVILPINTGTIIIVEVEVVVNSVATANEVVAAVDLAEEEVDLVVVESEEWWRR
jgi:hypothetical protein